MTNTFFKVKLKKKKNTIKFLFSMCLILVHRLLRFFFLHSQKKEQPGTTKNQHTTSSFLMKRGLI